MAMNMMCSRCERPVSKRYWMNIFDSDGNESKVFRGKPPANMEGKVIVYIDEKCPAGWNRPYRRELDSTGTPVESEVEVGQKTYRLRDLHIVRKGDRYLMVLPHHLVSIK